MPARNVMSPLSRALRLAKPVQYLRFQTPSRSRFLANATSVDPDEVNKFNQRAAQWWDPTGSAAPLHRLNPVRIAVIRAAIERRMRELGAAAPTEDTVRGAVQARPPLAGVSLVDVGCGGGLVAEPLARLGANVLGIDMAEEGIAVAKQHATADPALAMSARLDYRISSVEQLVQEGRVYDTVLALEIIEHVAKPALFLQECAALLKPGGLLVVSTFNRTALSYALGVVAVERVLKWLPRGTHDWERFVTPAEVQNVLEQEAGLACDEVVGITFDPVRNKFVLSDDDSVSYMLTAFKHIRT